MATPNLALIPSAYKARKVYSVLPNTGAGDFTFIRSGNATRINKDGLIETVDSHVPRLNYDLYQGKPKQCPSLLLEPSATNLVDNSVNFFLNSWSGTRVSEGSTIVSPNGNNEAHKLIASSVNNTHYREFTVSSASAGSYTGSCFFKKGEYSVGVIRMGADNNANRYSIYFSLEDGSFIQTATVGSPTGTAYKIDNYGNGWYRLSVTITHTSNDLRMSLSTSPSDYTNSNGLPVFLGNSSDGGYAWGGQLEQQLYATSYIPTSGSTETRNAEVCQDAGNAATFNDSEGVLMAEISALANDGTFKFISLSNDNTNHQNVVWIYYRSDANQINFRVVAGGSSSFDDIYTIEDATLNTKLALKYKENDFSAWVNGFEVLSDDSGSTFAEGTLKTLEFNRPDDINNFYGKTKQIQYFDSALTDSQLEYLTSYRSFGDMVESQNYIIQ